MAGTGDNMKNDHQYAEVLEMMRSQGAKDNPTLAQIGVMQSSNSVKIDDLVLNAEDLYIADYLVAGYTRQIKVPYVAGVSVDTTQSNGFASKDNPDPDTRVWKQSQITYTDGLKAGDMVLVQKLNDNNKYVIIARVVEAYMSLFPFATTEDLTLADQEVTASSIREYEIDFEKGTLTGRIVTGVDALCVWAYLALKAKRYRWIIYSWGYGDEVYDLIGYSYSEEYLNSEVRRYMEECLFENEHITGVQDLEVSQIKDVLHIKFTLVTDVGSKEVEMDV